MKKSFKIKWFENFTAQKSLSLSDFKKIKAQNESHMH